MVVSTMSFMRVVVGDRGLIEILFAMYSGKMMLVRFAVSVFPLVLNSSARVVVFPLTLSVMPAALTPFDFMRRTLMFPVWVTTPLNGTL